MMIPVCLSPLGIGSTEQSSSKGGGNMNRERQPRKLSAEEECLLIAHKLRRMAEWFKAQSIIVYNLQDQVEQVTTEEKYWQGLAEWFSSMVVLVNELQEMREAAATLTSQMAGLDSLPLEAEEGLEKLKKEIDGEDPEEEVKGIAEQLVRLAEETLATQQSRGASGPGLELASLVLDHFGGEEEPLIGTG